MLNNEFQDKKILVTGGTGSIGSVIVRRLLEFQPKQIRVFSRDETKQYQLMHEFNHDSRLRFIIGDVRDKEKIDMAMEGVDVVFHAAAMKHVLFCENDPFEAVKTNVLGTQNVISAALDNGVAKVVGISTDKAADPISVMGCTKSLAERMMLATYHYKGGKQTKFCFVRFGNVLSTRGSILPLFYQQIKKGGPVTVTDERMHRFFMSINEAVGLIFQAMVHMQDGEIFVLKMPVIKISDLAKAMIEIYAPQFGFKPEDINIKYIGRKRGERYHEKLLSEDESDYAFETGEMFIVPPVIGYEQTPNFSSIPNVRKCVPGSYTTEGKTLLTVEQIKRLIYQDQEALMRTLNGNSIGEIAVRINS